MKIKIFPKTYLQIEVSIIKENDCINKAVSEYMGYKIFNALKTIKGSYDISLKDSKIMFDHVSEYRNSGNRKKVKNHIIKTLKNYSKWDTKY